MITKSDLKEKNVNMEYYEKFAKEWNNARKVVKECLQKKKKTS